MTLTHLDLDRIEGLAKAATPGPWKLWRKGSQRVEDDRGLYVAETGPYDEKGHTAAYLVAVQPSAVLAMITRIRELEEALEPLLAAAEGLSHGEDWNNGTHAKHHKYRQKLLDAIAPARTALQRETP